MILEALSFWVMTRSRGFYLEEEQTEENHTTEQGGLHPDNLSDGLPRGLGRIHLWPRVVMYSVV